MSFNKWEQFFAKKSDNAENKSKKSKVYLVRYWELTSLDRLIEAESAEDAKRQMRELIEYGEIDLSDLYVDKSGYKAHVASRAEKEQNKFAE